MKTNKKIQLIAIGLIAISIFIILIVSNTCLTITNYNLQCENLPSSFNNFKIVHLSDLHNWDSGQDNKKLLTAIEQQNPDIIVMTGDMVTATPDGAEIDVFISFAQQLAGKYDVFFINGNHEYDIDATYPSLLHTPLSESGFHVLKNEKISISRDDQTIDIYGIPWHYFYNKRGDKVIFDLDKIKEFIGEKNDRNFSVLLTHDPSHFDIYSDWGADLTLCGHMHGGMIRIPFIGGVISPEGAFFPKYDAGLFDHNNKRLIVSRGLGNGNRGIRFLNPPEMVVITLKTTQR